MYEENYLSVKWLAILFSKDAKKLLSILKMWSKFTKYYIRFKLTHNTYMYLYINKYQMV